VYTFLLFLLILDAVILIPVVLLQSGKGGGLAAMGGGAGTDSMFGNRHAVTLLTKLTWWTGGLFVALSFALAILSSRPEAGGSILRRELQGTAPAPTGAATPSPLTPAGGTQPATTPATGTAPAGSAPATAPATPAQPPQ
jgi:preprotein translocase subunit SecG